jgi:hypothetical protein
LWLGLGLVSLYRLRRRWRNGLRLSRHGRWSRLPLLRKSRRCHHVYLCRNGLRLSRHGRWSRLPLLRRSWRCHHVYLCRNRRGHHMLCRDRYGRWRRLCRHWRGRDFRVRRRWCRFRCRRSLACAGAGFGFARAGTAVGAGFAFAVALGFLAELGFSRVPVGAGVAVAPCVAQDCHGQGQHIALAGSVRSINADTARGTVICIHRTPSLHRGFSGTQVTVS